MEAKVKEYFLQLFSGKIIAIVGFGREGKSSYKLIRGFMPSAKLIIADSNPNISGTLIDGLPLEQHDRVVIASGNQYLEMLSQCDIIVKSPGISFTKLTHLTLHTQITSQTEIFLELYKEQVIGITGTKGKSTTASLLYHILQLSGKKAFLGGNIGVPPFDLIPAIDRDSIVVYEMSSHQLEGIKVSPFIGILVNIFQEHLDHFPSFRDYQLAKYNIARWQSATDYFICNTLNSSVIALLEEQLPQSSLFGIQSAAFNGRGVYCEDGDMHIQNHENTHIIRGICQEIRLAGSHNLNNVLAAALAAHLAGVGDAEILEGVRSFEGLPHRLERVGEVNGVLYYNDSISTIPESTIEALKTLPLTQTLLLGGVDRGIDYGALCLFLQQNPIAHIIFLGKAGKRIMQMLEQLNGKPCAAYWYFDDFEPAVKKTMELTKPGSICLLSPAAASYDMFVNFEERGEKFRQLIHAAAQTSA